MEKELKIYKDYCDFCDDVTDARWILKNNIEFVQNEDIKKAKDLIETFERSRAKKITQDIIDNEDKLVEYIKQYKGSVTKILDDILDMTIDDQFLLKILNLSCQDELDVYEATIWLDDHFYSNIIMLFLKDKDLPSYMKTKLFATLQY